MASANVLPRLDGEGRTQILLRHNYPGFRAWLSTYLLYNGDGVIVKKFEKNPLKGYHNSVVWGWLGQCFTPKRYQNQLSDIYFLSYFLALKSTLIPLTEVI